MKLKNIIFIFILSLAFTSISYASFPISDTLGVKQDTINKESIEAYHLRMQKMGFDLEDCKCESCQIIKNDSDSNKKLTIYKSSSSKQMYRTAIILFGISIITFAGSIIHLINCIDDSSKCDGSGMPYLYLSMIFGFSSIIALIKGISISSKNKKKIKKQN